EKLPQNGALMVIERDAVTGHTDQFALSQWQSRGADFTADIDAIVLLLSLATGYPPHWLGSGNSSTYNTSAAMGEPARASVSSLRNALRTMLQNMMTLELRRRNGTRALYKQTRVRTLNGGRDRNVSTVQVPAERVEIPWNFPPLNTMDTAAIVAKVQAAALLQLASKRTLSQELGYDPALENERMAEEGTRDSSNPQEETE
ncbi:MAG: hypothetical protein ACRCWJ_03430, partial [Casimicrobium sp.]